MAEERFPAAASASVTASGGRGSSAAPAPPMISSCIMAKMGMLCMRVLSVLQALDWGRSISKEYMARRREACLRGCNSWSLGMQQLVIGCPWNGKC